MRPGIAPLVLAMAISALSRPASAQTFAFDFDAVPDGWECGYSDYLNEGDFQFECGRARLPGPLDTTRFGFRMKGMNRSDDMFMFLRRKVEGLVPGARYAVSFKVRLASDAAADGIGIGGSPGSSVFLKIGVVAVKPLDVNGRMNIDKGDQSRPGPDMDTIGHIGKSAGASGYASIERGNAGRTFSFTAAADGTGWIVLGTDSGFEGLTTLYYQRVEAVFARPGTGVERRGRIGRTGKGRGAGRRVTADGRDPGETLDRPASAFLKPRFPAPRD